MRPCKSLNVFFDPEFRVDVTIQLQRVVDAGFHCLDMNFWDWSHDPRSPFMQDDWQNWVERIAEAAQRAGAKFTQAHAHVHNFYDEQAKDIHERQIERSIIGAGMLGVPWIVMHPSQRTDWAEPGSMDKMLADNVSYYRMYAELAAKWKTGLALENMRQPASGLTTAEQLCDLIDWIDRPNVGACWDTGHAHLAHQDQPAAIHLLNHRLHALHVADNQGERDEHTMPFVGSIDWPPLIDALRETGYDGDLTFEAHNFVHKMPEACKAEALRLMYCVGTALIG
ncbi:MAG: sugar phosphate isomerase/epimerase [Clostridia bacterium]|nr:sugar phosphate isomerase/epimerase [Clostridia bacterium]